MIAATAIRGVRLLLAAGLRALPWLAFGCLVATQAAGQVDPESLQPADPVPTGVPADSIPEPRIERLPDGSVRVGRIELDRSAGSFTVPARILDQLHQNEHGLFEYFAVKRDGYKAYEALLELDATAAEFNLACILLGFDPARATLPRFHFDPTPVAGDPVELWVEWELDDVVHRVRAAELVTLAGRPVTDHDWVYTGSSFISPGVFLAEQTGALIGFVHDRDSVIEHRRGIGLGASEPPGVNRDRLPPIDTPLRLLVRNPAAGNSESTSPRP